MNDARIYNMLVSTRGRLKPWRLRPDGILMTDDGYSVGSALHWCVEPDRAVKDQFAQNKAAHAALGITQDEASRILWAAGNNLVIPGQVYHLDPHLRKLMLEAVGLG
jgi:hypothetical protein